MLRQCSQVDIISWKYKHSRITAQIKDICAILSGLQVAQDYRKGQDLIRDRDFADNEEFFQAVFEVGRRYKASRAFRCQYQHYHGPLWYSAGTF